MKCICGVLIVLFNFGLVFSGLSDYFSPLTTFFSSSSTETNSVSLSNDIDHKIPYEISVSDEKFISQAIKLTGVQESELDKCQHAVSFFLISLLLSLLSLFLPLRIALFSYVWG